MRRPGLFFALLLSAVAALSAEADFNIDAQPLAAALAKYARQADLQVLFPQDTVRNLKGNAVRGKLDKERALRQLLEKTGLEASFASNGTVLVKAAGAEDRAHQPTAVAADMRLAQQEGVSDVPTEAPAQQTDGPLEMLVTGERIGVINEGVIPRKENEALRYEILDRQALDRSGATSLPELFRQISSVTNYGTGTQQAYGTQVASPNGISSTNDPITMRGLGTQQTLVMINGRRLYGSDTVGPDISRIPMSAIERIEILQTSGSAIYGANAVGGAINIVLKKNAGAGGESPGEVNLYAGTAAGGAGETRATWYQGLSVNEGRTGLSFIAELKNVEPLHLGDRGYHLQVLEKFPRGSADYNRQVGQLFNGSLATVMTPAGTPLGIPGNLTASIAVLPAGSNGVLTPASFAATAGHGLESTQRLDRAVLVPGAQSYSLFGTVEHEFTPNFGGYTELSYRYTDNSTSSYAGIVGVMTMTPVNPNNPFGRAVNVYVDPTDFPDDRVKSIQRTMRAVAGLRGQFSAFGKRQFSWATDFSWDRNETYASNVRYTQYLRAAVFAGLYNPLRDLTSAPMADAATLANARSEIEVLGHPQIVATNWRLNGDLFEAWGGPSRFSLGAEFRVEKQYNRQTTYNGPWSALPQAPQGFADGLTESERRARAVYTELTLPLVGERNARPMLRELSVSAAVRMEKYEDFRSAAPPTLAVKYAPVQDLALRASYSEGFQPPTLQSLNNVGSLLEDVEFPGAFVDPLRPGLPLGTFTIRGGFGNPDLKPEVSETWDAGAVITPRWIPGLTLNASYFRYDKKDVVAVLDFQQVIDFFPGNYTRGPNLDTDPAGTPGPIDFFDLTFFNISGLFTDGWDYKVSYTRDAGSAGVFSIDATATRTSNFRTRDVPNAPDVDTLGDLGTGASFPVEWRGRLGLNWQRQAWNLNWAARYTDRYRLNSNDPTPENPTRAGYDGPYIPGTLEHDLQVGYDFSAGGAGARGLLQGTRLTLGALNVFDKTPPYVTNRGQLFYSFFNDPRQRFVYLEARKSF